MNPREHLEYFESYSAHGVQQGEFVCVLTYQVSDPDARYHSCEGTPGLGLFRQSTSLSSLQAAGPCSWVGWHNLHLNESEKQKPVSIVFVSISVPWTNY